MILIKNYHVISISVRVTPGLIEHSRYELILEN